MLNLFLKIALVVVVIITFIFLKRFSKLHSNKNYDERQLIYRNKAYSNAACVALFFNLIFAMEGETLGKIFSVSFVAMATLFLIAGTYAISSILYDAYFISVSKRSFFIIYGLLICSQLYGVYRQWSDDAFFRQGRVYLTGSNSVSLFFVSTFGLILLITVYKIWKDKKEVEE